MIFRHGGRCDCLKAAGGEELIWLLFLKQSSETPQKETYLLALHTYDSANPEDLSFHQGDKITLLSKGDIKLHCLKEAQLQILTPPFLQ